MVTIFDALCKFPWGAFLGLIFNVVGYLRGKNYSEALDTIANMVKNERL